MIGTYVQTAVARVKRIRNGLATGQYLLRPLSASLDHSLDLLSVTKGMHADTGSSASFFDDSYGLHSTLESGSIRTKAPKRQQHHHHHHHHHQQPPEFQYFAQRPDVFLRDGTESVSAAKGNVSSGPDQESGTRSNAAMQLSLRSQGAYHLRDLRQLLEAVDDNFELALKIVTGKGHNTFSRLVAKAISQEGVFDYERSRKGRGTSTLAFPAKSTFESQACDFNRMEQTMPATASQVRNESRALTLEEVERDLNCHRTGLGSLISLHDASSVPSGFQGCIPTTEGNQAHDGLHTQAACDMQHVLTVAEVERENSSLEEQHSRFLPDGKQESSDFWDEQPAASSAVCALTLAEVDSELSCRLGTQTTERFETASSVKAEASSFDQASRHAPSEGLYFQEGHHNQESGTLGVVGESDFNAGEMGGAWDEELIEYETETRSPVSEENSRPRYQSRKCERTRQPEPLTVAIVAGQGLGTLSVAQHRTNIGADYFHGRCQSEGPANKVEVEPHGWRDDSFENMSVLADDTDDRRLRVDEHVDYAAWDDLSSGSDSDDGFLYESRTLAEQLEAIHSSVVSSKNTVHGNVDDVLGFACEVHCPIDRVGLVIGRKGCTVQQLREATSTNIFFDEEDAVVRVVLEMGHIEQYSTAHAPAVQSLCH